MTPGEFAYNTWRQELIDNGHRQYEGWKYLTTESKTTWETVAQAIMAKYGAIY